MSNYTFYKKNEMNSLKYGNYLVIETILKGKVSDFNQSYIFATKIFDTKNNTDITSHFNKDLPSDVFLNNQVCFNTDTDKDKSTLVKEIKINEFEEKKMKARDELSEYILTHSVISSVKDTIKKQLTVNWRSYLKTFFQDNQITIHKMKNIVLSFIEGVSYHNAKTLDFARYINTMDDLRVELGRSISSKHIKNSLPNLYISESEYKELPDAFYKEFANVIVEVCLKSPDISNEIIKTLIGELSTFSDGDIDNLINLLVETDYHKTGSSSQKLKKKKTTSKLTR